MQFTTEEQALYDLIHGARTNKTPVEGKNGNRGIDLYGAYRIQEARQGERVLKGYKLGLISPAKQQQMNIDTPIFGRIYADMLYQNRVTLADFVQPRIEPEIAVVLHEMISPDASPELVERAIGGYFLGVDILDSVWKDYKFTAPEVVADNTSGGGFLLAGRMSDHMESGMLQLYVNGKLQTEGTADALGDPIERLQWLAGCVGELPPGMIIFLGSPAAAVPAQPGTLEVVSSEGAVIVAKIIG